MLDLASGSRSRSNLRSHVLSRGLVLVLGWGTIQVLSWGPIRVQGRGQVLSLRSGLCLGSGWVSSWERGLGLRLDSSVESNLDLRSRSNLES